MALTDAQLQTLKNDIDANSGPGGEFEQYVGDLSKDANQAIADAYNLTASPDFWVFKTSVDVDTAREAINWAEILTNAKLGVDDRWAFDVMMANGNFNPALRNTRDGLAEIFNGQPLTRNALLDISVRLATRGEKLFHVVGDGPGGGDGSAKAQSAVMTREAAITQVDVSKARRL